MSTITQLAPFSDTVVAAVSGTYTNLLQTEGNNGSVTFLTTETSIAVSVYPGGQVETDSQLQPGVYTVSGTMFDLFGNTGTWSFVLTVTGAASPNVSVVPAQQTLPSGIEIAVPFRIDPATGGVAILTSQIDIMNQHITTLVMTNLYERVMLPGYGGSLPNRVFDLIDNLTSGVLANDLKTVITNGEPSVSFDGEGTGITINPVVGRQDSVSIIISYNLVPYAGVNSINLTIGGSIAGQVSP